MERPLQLRSLGVPLFAIYIPGVFVRLPGSQPDPGTWTAERASLGALLACGGERLRQSHSPWDGCAGGCPWRGREPGRAVAQPMAVAGLLPVPHACLPLRAAGGLPPALGLQPQRPEQGAARWALLDRFEKLIQAPASLSEQVTGLVEKG